MKVLITTPSAWGHLQQMVLLAKALQDRGHDVRWATGADSCSWLSDIGVSPVPAGIEQSELMRARLRIPPETRQLPPKAIPDVMFARIFGDAAAPAMLADLLPLVREWPPDLVLSDAAEFAGPIVAALVGVPSVTKSFGALLPRQRVAMAGEHVENLWRSVGLEPRPFGGSYDYLYVDIYPTALQPDWPDYLPRRQLLRPVSYDVGVALSDSPAADWPPDFPAVYVTMGTVFGDMTTLRRIVDAVATLDIGTLVTVGPQGDPAQLGSQPSNVRVERYVPQSTVLDRCRLVVSHAGSGTVLATVSHGVPQLCLPQGADQFLNAAAVVRGRVGLSISPAEADSRSIVEAASRLLDEPSFTHRAEAVSESIAQMPDAATVAVVMEELAATRSMAQQE
jgi:UDP:flavonoid glycosyltransferase YjiC (YdhE family)